MSLATRLTETIPTELLKLGRQATAGAITLTRQASDKVVRSASRGLAAMAPAAVMEYLPSWKSTPNVHLGKTEAQDVPTEAQDAPTSSER